MTFSMILPRRPVSLGGSAKSRESYKIAVSKAAASQLQDYQAPSGTVYARIVWFHREPTSQDVDNIIKPILDALKGVVYLDDVKVIQCLATKIDIVQTKYEIDDTIISPDLYRQLIDTIELMPHVLYVEVGNVTSIDVMFGVVESKKDNPE